MGVKKLQIKEELHYRKGPTWGYCSQCNQYVTAFEIGSNDKFITAEPRCKIIGLKPGRMYKINPGYICDKYDNSESIKRIRGDF